MSGGGAEGEVDVASWESAIIDSILPLQANFVWA